MDRVERRRRSIESLPCQIRRLVIQMIMRRSGRRRNGVIVFLTAIGNCYVNWAKQAGVFLNINAAKLDAAPVIVLSANNQAVFVRTDTLGSSIGRVGFRVNIPVRSAHEVSCARWDIVEGKFDLVRVSSLVRSQHYENSMKTVMVYLQGNSLGKRMSGDWLAHGLSGFVV